MRLPEMKRPWTVTTTTYAETLAGTLGTLIVIRSARDEPDSGVFSQYQVVLNTPSPVDDPITIAMADFIRDAANSDVPLLLDAARRLDAAYVRICRGLDDAGMEEWAEFHRAAADLHRALDD
jgi:hypothetical protein